MAYQQLNNFKLIDGVSMGASITSSALETIYQDNVGIQLVWTGSPVGTFDVQISADHRQDSQGNILNAGTWTSLPLSPTISAAGSADNAYIEICPTTAAYMRIVYTKGSSTGTLTAWISSKAV